MTEVTIQTSTLWEILLKLKTKDILAFCRSSQTVNTFCKNDIFWKDKLQLDYPGYAKQKNETWISICLYLNENKNKNIDVVIRHNNNKNLEKIKITPYTTFDTLYDYVDKKYNLFGFVITTGNTYSIEPFSSKIRLDSLDGTSLEVSQNDFLYRIMLPEGNNLYSLIEAVDVM